MLRNNIAEVQKLVEKEGIVFLSYGGFLTQTLISGITEALEGEVEHFDLNSGFANNIFTIFIELAQNMMNYSNRNMTAASQRELLLLVKKMKVHFTLIVKMWCQKKIKKKLKRHCRKYQALTEMALKKNTESLGAVVNLRTIKVLVLVFMK